MSTSHDTSHSLKIQLKHNAGIVLIDNEDADLAQFTWRRLQSKSNLHPYAARTIRIAEKNRDVLMHRIVLERMLGRTLLSNECCDHINFDGLDNRRCNLRVAYKWQNNVYQGKRKDNTSGIKGVHWHKRTQIWHARISVNGKRIFLGQFDNVQDAAKARYEAEAKYHGEFANH